MSTRWELIRDTIGFIADQGQVPTLIVQSKHVSMCGLPQGVASTDGRVVLNVSDNATGGTLRVGMYQIAFNCRFGGEPAQLAFAPEAVEAVYSYGNEGIKLILPNAPVEDYERNRPKSKGHLRVVH